MKQENKEPHAAKEHKSEHRYWVWAILAIIILLTVAIRVRLLEIPLERDEGEYAYAGQLILQGIAPYAQVYNMKMPGIYAAYALILAIFGQTTVGIHLGLLVVNAATILLMFLLCSRLFDSTTGIVTGASYAFMSLSWKVFGFSANAEHFVILAALGGILLLLHAVDYRKWLSLLAGSVLLGLAFLMKQHGAAFIVFAGLYLLFCELRRRPFGWRPLMAKGILFLVGAMLPFAITCLVLWQAGVFEKFWFWTFTYAREYVTSVPLSAGLNSLKVRMAQIVSSAILLWILAGIGVASLWWNRKARRHRLFVAGFLLFSFLAICPGFHFRPHYFILLLPAIALLAGVGASSITAFMGNDRAFAVRKAAAILYASVAILYAVLAERAYLFELSPNAISRAIYGGSPFPESVEIANYIKKYSSKDDSIAILGSEPQICFYARRHSASAYIYVYHLVETQKYAKQMQEEMIHQIEAARPKFMVFVGAPTSWLVQADSEKMIFEWFQQYRQKYYEHVGTIDIISKEQTIYRWDERAIEYSPRSEFWLLVLRRKD